MARARVLESKCIGHPVHTTGQMVCSVENAEVISIHRRSAGQPEARTQTELTRRSVLDLKNVEELRIEGDCRRNAEAARQWHTELGAARGRPQFRPADRGPNRAGTER